MSPLEPPVPTDQSVDADEYEDLYSSIAPLLAELSQPSDGPIGYDLTDDQFDSAEVNFETSSWLLRVAQVQSWLHLDSAISRKDIDDDAEAAAAQLFVSLAQPNPQACFRAVDGAIQLTLLGADALNTRLDIALKLRDRFLEEVEATNRKDATAAWNESWEEEDPTDADPGPIRAQTDNWRISDFAGKAAGGRLNLNPSYQRGDVWPTSDAQKLIESVLRGIPLPSVILLQPSSERRELIYEVVDGKQRLTALLRFMGKHPTAITRVDEAHANHPQANLKQYFHSDYRRFKKLWRTHMGESLTAKTERKYYFPFPLKQSSVAFRGDLSGLAGKYFYEIKGQYIQVGAGQETVQEVFEGTGDYKIPLILYLDATPRQIHDVFHLYNRQGKHLNAEEIRNAVYHDVDLTRLLLVASGDHKATPELVPFAHQALFPKFNEIAEALDGYRFGSLRYRRTKVLSWVVSVLLCPSLRDGALVIKSTAKHVDTLLDSIRERADHPLRNGLRLTTLVNDLHRAITAHSEFDDGWSDRFKDNSDGTKWQELQLVASLVGVFLISMATGDVYQTLNRRREEITKFTRSHLRPRKTQNKDQWAFIGKIALGLIDVVEISPTVIEKEMKARYGESCLTSMKAAAAQYSSES